MKKTKIVATIADMNCSVDFISKLYESGMNVVRLNSAHQSLEGSLRIINNVRSVSDKIAIMMDTKGPEIRVGSLGEPVSTQTGQLLCFSGTNCDHSQHKCIPVTYEHFARDIPLGSRILIDDGEIELTAVEKRSDCLVCRAENDGVIHRNKGINVPGTHINLPSLSEKDLRYIKFSIDNELDFIAHSFVRNKTDVDAVQAVLDEHHSNIKIIAKIENQSGVDRIDEILDSAYGIMVARGDLAIEIPFEKVPVVQKMLIGKCISRRKPIIIATQMLHSMIDEPRPTRAEVNDVATAIYSHADAVMLSGETAVGAYPVESVKAMAAIASEVEKSKEPIIELPPDDFGNNTAAFLIMSAVQGAVTLDAHAIIADSTSGRTIRDLAAYRGNRPVYALCYSMETVRHLALSYGVSARFIEPQKVSHRFVGNALRLLEKEGTLSGDAMVVVVAGNLGRSRGVTFVEIGPLDSLVEASGMP